MKNASLFNYPQYTIRRKLFTLFGQQYRIFNPDNQLVLFAKMKAFKLKEDIRLFQDETMTQEALVIKARQIIDFGAAYDLFDPASNQRFGALRRKGLKSMLRDEWEILNFDDQPIAIIEEDSWVLALIRRAFLSSLIPQKYHATSGGQQVAHYVRHFSIFLMKMTVTIYPEAAGKVDSRLLLAAGVLLCAVEGRQG